MIGDRVSCSSSENDFNLNPYGTQLADCQWRRRLSRVIYPKSAYVVRLRSLVWRNLRPILGDEWTGPWRGSLQCAFTLRLRC